MPLLRLEPHLIFGGSQIIGFERRRLIDTGSSLEHKTQQSRIVRISGGAKRLHSILVRRHAFNAARLASELVLRDPFKLVAGLHANERRAL